MFVVSKRNIRIPSSDGSQVFSLPKDFMGEVPAWVSKTAYFKNLVNDGKVIVSKSKKDTALDAAAKAAAETEEKARAEAETRAQADNNKTGSNED
jgi:antitoxin component of MazEF toxin-antitoxin module